MLIVAIVPWACLAQPLGDKEVLEINKLLKVFEFRREAWDRLRAIPPDSVPYLTQRLNAVSAGQPTEARLFGFLMAKLEQYHSELPLETVTAGLNALRKKINAPLCPDREFRAKELQALEALIASAAKAKHGSGSKP